MSNHISRRTFLQGAAIAAAAPAAHGATLHKLPPGPAAPHDTAYWNKVAGHYTVNREFANLENAYYGIMATPVAREFKRNIDLLNKDNSRLLRQHFDGDGVEAIRVQLARHLGVAPGEIALTRGATESLQNLISNYLPLRQGDTVMYGDLDYDAMQYAMEDLAARRGASVAIVRMPEPATRQNVLDAYDKAMRAHPRTRVLLLTHVSHRTGLLFPVADISAMAKSRGIDVIVDVAHSWGQVAFSLPDLNADFIGGNLHKWIGAPLGLGFVYIRKERLADIGVHLGDRDFPATDIRSRVHSGTANAAAAMSIPAALAFHDAIGIAAKSARLRYLRDYWVSRVRAFSHLQILTPDEPGMYGALTSFRVKGKATPDENKAIARHLMEQFSIFTVARHGPAGGSCVRVTPALFTRTSELDRLVEALSRLA
jgi:isopenicillin-N epimerase